MKTIIELLNANQKVSSYKINVHNKESYELFYIKGKLETVRCTDTCDKEVTVYVDHGDFKGDSSFYVYPSTTAEQLAELIEKAANTAMLINNRHYDLPNAESGSYVVESNFSDYSPAELAAQIANAAFAANTIENASINSLEIFINKHTETVVNSLGLNKTQVRYDAMVEAIPTFNGAEQSVELYEQYNFSAFNEDAVRTEIAEKLAEVKARYEAVKPDAKITCKIILNKLELYQLFADLAEHFSYGAVHGHYSLFKKGDTIQKDATGDLIGITMAGSVPGSIRSAMFDRDGLSLGTMRIIESGKGLNYFGANRFGQYLGETPTGALSCICVDPGSADAAAFENGPYLEVVSMSGLQVDFFNDYIGGEIRLAYYNSGEKTIPVTGISFSGKLSDVLSSIRLSSELAMHKGYYGPKKAMLESVEIF